MAGINWQRLWCYLGFHVGKWGEAFKQTTAYLDSDEPWNKSKEYETYRSKQRRVCTNCGVITHRCVR